MPSSVNQDRIICGLFAQSIPNNQQIIHTFFEIICGLFADYLTLFVEFLADYLLDCSSLFVVLSAYF